MTVNNVRVVRMFSMYLYFGYPCTIWYSQLKSHGLTVWIYNYGFQLYNDAVHTSETCL